MTDALRFEGLRVSTHADVLGPCHRPVLCGLPALGPDGHAGTEGSATQATLLLTAGGESLPFSVMGFACRHGRYLRDRPRVPVRHDPPHTHRNATPARPALANSGAAGGGGAVAAVAVLAVCWLVGTVALGEPLLLLQGPIPAAPPAMSS